jgi:acetyl esterase
VTGSINTHDNICRKLANRASAIVISVDYRLAPENKFPAAIEDAYDALNWAHSQARSFGGDPGRISVCGDSAGGNLAAVTCLLARDRVGPKIAFQALIYPGVDASNLDTESYRLNGKGYYLTRENIAEVIPLYVNNDDEVLHHYVSPLLAHDLSGLPPALVITAEFDPLLSEGQAYADKLKEAGVPCSLHNYPGMVHGFVSFGGLLPQSDQAIVEIAAALS